MFSNALHRKFNFYFLSNFLQVFTKCTRACCEKDLVLSQNSVKSKKVPDIPESFLKSLVKSKMSQDIMTMVVSKTFFQPFMTPLTTPNIKNSHILAGKYSFFQKKLLGECSGKVVFKQGNLSPFSAF